MEKKRYPRAEALAVAEELTAALAPVCSRIAVAGSLRRGKPTVGDVELLFVPRFEERPHELWKPLQFNLAEEEIGNLLARGTLAKRPSIKGTFAWGAKNKLALHRNGIPVDLFTATAANWWNYLVCRTGPAESNMLIAMEAQKRGWKWNPYDAGFSRGGPLAGEREEHAVTSEEDVFAFVGLPYHPPEERR